MSNSSFCLQQRQQEEEKTRKLLGIGLIASVVLHGAIGSATILLKEEPKTTEKPIELIVVDAPKLVPEVPKPKQEPPKIAKVTPPPPKPQPQKNQPVKTTQPQSAFPEPAKPESVQPSVTKVAPKPKTGTPTQSKLKPRQPQPRPSILTNPNPSASNIKVPEQPKVENNSPGIPSELDTPNNTSQGTGTENGTGNGGNGTGNGDDGTGNGGNGTGSRGNGNNNTSGTPTPVAARPTPTPPKPTPKVKPKVGNCIRNCEVKYPSVLNGVEGSASVRVTVDKNGDVVNAEIAGGHSNSQINEQALLAARKMKFASRSEEGTVSARVTINFTVAGSDFDRQARQRREQQERQAREQREQQERQAREREEQERQAREREEQRLERERQAQQQQQQQLPSPEVSPLPETTPPDVPDL